VSATVTVEVAAMPTVTVVSPAPGATLPTGDLELRLEVQHLVLDAAAMGSTPQAAHGNFEVRVDGAYHGTGTNLTYNITGLAPGTHTITISLHNNDHTPIPGAAPANITVVVAPPAGFLPGAGALGSALCMGAAAVLLQARSGRRAHR
jgi:hypothetical protein